LTNGTALEPCLHLPEPDARPPRNRLGFDTGCVKTLEAVVSAQQQNRTCGLGESFMRKRHSLRINLAPERSAEWFSHRQDPQATCLAEHSASIRTLPFSGTWKNEKRPQPDRPSPYRLRRHEVRKYGQRISLRYRSGPPRYAHCRKRRAARPSDDVSTNTPLHRPQER
jgi:hypothetical protein